MSLQRKKFASAYNRAKEKQCYRSIDDGYDSFYDYDDDSCGHDCLYCNPTLDFIRIGLLCNVLSKLRIRSASKVAETIW